MDELMPTNIEAEEAILGGILIDPEAISRVGESLRVEFFSIQSHQLIYQAVLTLFYQGKPTDLMTVTTWLADHNHLELIGGQIKLAQLVDRTVSAVNIDQYVALIEDKFLRRGLIKAGNEIVQLGHQTALPLQTVLDQAEQKVFGITQDRHQQDLISISETVTHLYREIEERHEGMILPGIPCGFYDLDAMTGGFQRSDLIIVAGRPSMGKCLSYDTLIVQPDGRLITLEEIYHHRQVQLLTLGENWQFYWTQPVAFINDGIKPVFRVKTQLGRCVDTTLTHPFLTLQGWYSLEQLHPGDSIAIPRKISIFGQETCPDYQVKLLVYFLETHDLVLDKFQTDLLLQKDFIQAFQEFTSFNIQPKIQPKDFSNFSLYFHECRQRYLEQTDFFEENLPRNLNVKTLPHFPLPPLVFRFEKSRLSFLLNRLFSLQGSVAILEKDHVQLAYHFFNEKLTRQVQHLLLRFGIITTLKYNGIPPSENLLSPWKLEITETESIITFISEIGSFSQIHILQKISQILIKQTPLQNLVSGEVYWDKIVSIEFIGNRQVYDLTIPHTHNFVANDICVHNTAFCTNIAHQIAVEQKLPIAIFSLEMSKEQLVQRLLSSDSGIESNRLRSGKVSQNEWESLSQSLGRLSELPIFIDDTPNVTVTEMRSKSRRLQAEQGGGLLGLILLDYLQLMEGSGSDNRVQELSRITRGLKGLARELNVPIIALSQLSRSVEVRTNKRPMMSDLRESGSIEQDADVIIMLYRDEYYNPDTPDRNISEIIITKHRNGPTGTVKLIFDPQFTRFRNPYHHRS